MKLYKESLRKLTVVGLPLLGVTMVYTLVTGGQACFGLSYAKVSVSAIALTPILQYYVFTAVLFALYGFSFLFSRPASDVYHSLPVKRTEMYVSVLLAAATWMGATILLNVLEMLLILLISGCPFVPVYIPLMILYYFVASMLVLAATAVGCALSGTFITALASTGVILLLPRFVQFLFARGIVERVPIVGWLDFGALLNPTTNAATGILATHLRHVYDSRIVTMPHILYSLLPMAVMLVVGWWLFKRRPSEFAQKGGGRIWTVVTATLLAFAVMMPITMNHQKVLSVYGFVLMAVALAVFLIYQMIATPKLKRTLMTLPCFLGAVLAVLGFSLLIETAADSMLNTTPDAAEIESVAFRGYDSKKGDPVYTTLLVGDIAFTDGETKQYVAQSLSNAVERIQDESSSSGNRYSEFMVVEPITIKLVGGGTVKRTIEFININELNALRLQNEDFERAVRQYPAIGSIQMLRVERGFTEEQQRIILETYLAESQEKDLLNGYYYRERIPSEQEYRSYAAKNEDQSLSGITYTGYKGSRRYFDSNGLRLELPKTVGLAMRTYNSYVQGEPLAMLNDVMDSFDMEKTSEYRSLNISINAFNCPAENGAKVERTAYFYMSKYTLESEYEYDQKQLVYMKRFIDLLSRATLTDDPNSLFIQLSWYYYADNPIDDEPKWDQPTVYLRFENPADEQEYLSLLEEWESLER